MRQRENALSVGMKSALRNPRTPGTVGRASGLKWSDNLEVRPRSDLAESHTERRLTECVSENESRDLPPARPLSHATLTRDVPPPPPPRRTLGCTRRATRSA